MPFYTQGPEQFAGVQQSGIDNLQSTFGEGLGAAFSEGFNDAPTSRIGSALDRLDDRWRGQQISAEDANRQYGIPGTLSFDKPVSDAVASDLNADKRAQLLRQQAMDSAPGGVIGSLARFGAGSLPQFLDPGNLALSFVPGLGEARLATMLGEDVAGSAVGRAVQGASQGVAGQAAFEPLNYVLDRDEHTDWSMGQALGNIAFGGVLGGGLHMLIPHERLNELSEVTPEVLENEATPQNYEQKRLEALPPEARDAALKEGVVSLEDGRPNVSGDIVNAVDPVRSVSGEGPFGPVFDGFDNDTAGAIEKLRTEQTGEVPGALTHPDIGPIDLVWGKEGTGASNGYGLAKLIKYHPEVIGDLQNIIAGMEVSSRSENRVRLESPDHAASVRLTYDGERKTWLLTAYQKRSAKQRSVSPAVTDNAREYASEDATTGTAPNYPANDTAGRETDAGDEITQDAHNFYQKQAARSALDLENAVRKSVSGENGTASFEQSETASLDHDAPAVPTDADLSEIEADTARIDAALQNVEGIEKEMSAIADDLKEADGIAKAYEAATACLIGGK